MARPDEQSSAAAADSALRPALRIVIVGHVDHGKSTLIGRLLHDTGSLPTGKLEELKQVSARRGVPIEWSFVLDAFQAERDQAITIDTTQIWFKTAQRDYVIIDAPGHREFLKNMVSGASSADAAILVIDAAEGVRETTRRHGYLLHILGIRQVAVAINKMDAVDYSESRFAEVSATAVQYLKEIGIASLAVVPISGRDGDNIATRSARSPWYKGSPILGVLESFEALGADHDLPLRMPVQDVYKFDQRRIVAGRIESGTLRAGDTLLFSPSNKTAKVHSIEAWHVASTPEQARAGESVGITLDEQIFVERGEVASHAKSPPILSSVFRATLFWLGHEPLVLNKTYKLKLSTQEVRVTVQTIDRVIDTNTLAGGPADAVERHSVAEVTLRSRRILALDEFRTLPRCGRFVLIDGYETVGGGIISMDGHADQRGAMAVKSRNLTAVEHRVSVPVRTERNGHHGGVLWFTGLSGAGKSTLAMEVEQQLFRKGYQVYVLDGDNVRGGLNANLGFSPEDRTENIRRVGEVAALFADAGILCITAFISPYQADRAMARRAAGASFAEIFVDADLATCEERDPKGLYRKARAGQISDFTGVSAPYEAPLAPELTVKTAEQPVESCAQRIVEFVEQNFSATESR